MQIAASNATLGSRENNLRCLWEHPGVIDIQGALEWDSNISSFPWNAYPSSSTPLVLFCGTHRIRSWGETVRPPQVVLKLLLGSDGSSTAGAILVGKASRGTPSSTDVFTSVTVTTAPTLKTLTLSPTLSNLGPRVVAPVTDNVTVPARPPWEDGRDTVMSFYIGVWNESGGKSQVSTLSLYLKEPA